MKMVPSEGLEPSTPRFEVWCSIQLSYDGAKAEIPPTISKHGNTNGFRLDNKPAGASQRLPAFLCSEYEACCY